MQSRELVAGDSLVELLTLDAGDLELGRGWLAGTVTTLRDELACDKRVCCDVEPTYSKGTGTPWGATVDLLEAGELAEAVLVTERDVAHSVVSEGGHGGNAGRLLSTTLGGGRDEETGELASVGTSGPLLTGAVPEGLPLGWEVTVSGWDTEEESVVLLEDLGVDDWDRLGLWWSVHLSENLGRKGLADPGGCCQLHVS